MSDHPTLPFAVPSEPERWVPAPRFEGRYEVSSAGRIRSIPKRGTRAGSALKPSRHGGGYLYVSLRVVPGKHAKSKRVMLHSLMAEAFLEPRPKGMVVRHLDGNPANNSVRNLAWGTPRENGLDETAHGRNHYANRTHCGNNHEFTPGNTGIRIRDGVYRGRYCKACHRDASQRRRQREREARKEAA